MRKKPTLIEALLANEDLPGLLRLLVHIAPAAHEQTQSFLANLQSPPPSSEAASEEVPDVVEEPRISTDGKRPQRPAAKPSGRRDHPQVDGGHHGTRRARRPQSETPIPWARAYSGSVDSWAEARNFTQDLDPGFAQTITESMARQGVDLNPLGMGGRCLVFEWVSDPQIIVRIPFSGGLGLLNIRNNGKERSWEVNLSELSVQRLRQILQAVKG